MNERSSELSAIGNIWPPEKFSFNLKRGIYDRQVLYDLPSFTRFINEHLNSVDLERGETDRISIRVIIPISLIPCVAELFSNVVEAIIPLDGAGEGLHDLGIVYLGRNSSERQPHLQDVEKSTSWIDQALKRPVISYDEILFKVLKQGYQLERLEMNSRFYDAKIRSQIAQLYARFGWTNEDTKKILEDPLSIIAVISYNGEIVSAGRAETAAITIGSHIVNVAEITDATTRDDHQGKGLYTAVGALLLQFLAHTNTNIAYGETNGSEAGVLFASHSLGRTFALEFSRKMRIPIRGYLPQHLPIAGAPRLTEHNNLFPSFMTRRTMRQRAMK